MDGVLADFANGVRDLCHVPFVEQGTKNASLINETMWEAMSHVDHFYLQLQPLPQAIEMFDTLYDRYGAKVEILTGVPKPARHIEHSCEDKVAWVRQYLSNDVIVHTVLRKEKTQFCEGPQDVLIDDFFVNCNEWRKHGGTAIHHTSVQKTLQSLEQLEKQ